MTSRFHAHAAAIAIACLGLAIPAAAGAATTSPGSGSGSSGGAGLGGSTTTTSSTSTTSSTTTSTGPGATSAQATPVGGPVSAAGNGFTLDTESVGTFERTLTFTGTVPASDHGDALVIQRETANGTWQNAAASTVATSGTFTVAWRANARGAVALRASLQPAGTSAAAASAAPQSTSPVLSVTIYQDARATIYGPGFYGHQTACGQKLTTTMLGVASRTLKCGTEVAIDYHGRSVTVPVIDRGPFANGASWDLTEATAKALGDPGTATIGTTSVPASTAASSTQATGADRVFRK